jgi:hypothetical protein
LGNFRNISSSRKCRSLDTNLPNAFGKNQVAPAKVAKPQAEIPEPLAKVPEALAKVPEPSANILEAAAEILMPFANILEAFAEILMPSANILEAFAKILMPPANILRTPAEIPDASATCHWTLRICQRRSPCKGDGGFPIRRAGEGQGAGNPVAYGEGEVPSERLRAFEEAKTNRHGRKENLGLTPFTPFTARQGKPGSESLSCRAERIGK